ncbi:hypothetical protein SynSYN20_01308 [Synechococcus sp. SYN20]|nr:hypothetical protein SynSYN20_01308 [Synechococcus sp. SYN20]
MPCYVQISRREDISNHNIPLTVIGNAMNTNKKPEPKTK